MKAHPDVERYRVREGVMASNERYGNNGAFVVPYSASVTLQMIASDGLGWEHVSVVPIHPRNKGKLYRVPTWDEMCFAKKLWWEDDECAVQYHPPKKAYRSAHDYCLHLWRPVGGEFPMPDPIMVAPEGVKVPL